MTTISPISKEITIGPNQPRNFIGSPIQWQWMMTKTNPAFSVSTHPAGLRAGMNAWGYPVPLSCLFYDRGALYFDSQECAVIGEFIEYKLRKDPGYPDKMANKIFATVEKIKRRQPKVSPKAGLRSLIRQFKKESMLYFSLLGFLSHRGSVQLCDSLQNRVRSIVRFRAGQAGRIEESDAIVEALSEPLHESAVIEEKLTSARLSIGYSASDEEGRKSRIDTYLRSYDWLRYVWMLGTSLRPAEVEQKFIALEPTARETIREVRKDRRETATRIEKLVADLHFDRQEKDLVRQYREWIYMRSEVKDGLSLAGYRLMPLLHRIVDLAGLPGSDAPWLTVDEITTADQLDLQAIAATIQSRKNGFSGGTINGVFSFRPFSEVNLLLKNEVQVTTTSEVRGNVAFRGIVTGTARVVLSPMEQGKVQRGDILVTCMTTPNYLPSMELSSGFVTDEGGITCHASIVAREMKKPCVIGTKKGTSVIKDGDLIELNAVTGVVKILKRT